MFFFHSCHLHNSECLSYSSKSKSYEFSSKWGQEQISYSICLISMLPVKAALADRKKIVRLFLFFQFLSPHYISDYFHHSFNCFIYHCLILITDLAGQNTYLNGLSNKNSSRVFFLFTARGVTDFSNSQSRNI